MLLLMPGHTFHPPSPFASHKAGGGRRRRTDTGGACRAVGGAADRGHTAGGHADRGRGATRRAASRPGQARAGAGKRGAGHARAGGARHQRRPRGAFLGTPKGGAAGAACRGDGMSRRCLACIPAPPDPLLPTRHLMTLTGCELRSVSCRQSETPRLWPMVPSQHKALERCGSRETRAMARQDGCAAGLAEPAAPRQDGCAAGLATPFFAQRPQMRHTASCLPGNEMPAMMRP